MLHVYDWDSVFVGSGFFVFFAFAVWFNSRKARRQSGFNYGELESSTFQANAELQTSIHRTDDSSSQESDRREVMASAGRDYFDLGKMYDGFSTDAASGYSGPSVNTNGAPMVGCTDIYGNSFGASSPSGSELTRWD